MSLDILQSVSFGDGEGVKRRVRYRVQKDSPRFFINPLSPPPAPIPDPPSQVVVAPPPRAPPRREMPRTETPVVSKTKAKISRFGSKNRTNQPVMCPCSFAPPPSALEGPCMSCRAAAEGWSNPTRLKSLKVKVALVGTGTVSGKAGGDKKAAAKAPGSPETDEYGMPKMPFKCTRAEANARLAMVPGFRPEYLFHFQRRDKPIRSVSQYLAAMEEEQVRVAKAAAVREAAQAKAALLTRSDTLRRERDEIRDKARAKVLGGAVHVGAGDGEEAGGSPTVINPVPAARQQPAAGIVPAEAAGGAGGGAGRAGAAAGAPTRPAAHRGAAAGGKRAAAKGTGGARRKPDPSSISSSSSASTALSSADLARLDGAGGVDPARPSPAVSPAGSVGIASFDASPEVQRRGNLPSPSSWSLCSEMAPDQDAAAATATTASTTSTSSSSSRRSTASGGGAGEGGAPAPAPAGAEEAGGGSPGAPSGLTFPAPEAVGELTASSAAACAAVGVAVAEAARKARASTSPTTSPTRQQTRPPTPAPAPAPAPHAVASQPPTVASLEAQQRAEAAIHGQPPPLSPDSDAASVSASATSTSAAAAGYVPGSGIGRSRFKGDVDPRGAGWAVDASDIKPSVVIRGLRSISSKFHKVKTKVAVKSTTLRSTSGRSPPAMAAPGLIEHSALSTPRSTLSYPAADSSGNNSAESYEEVESQAGSRSIHMLMHEGGVVGSAGAAVGAWAAKEVQAWGAVAEEDGGTLLGQNPSLGSWAHVPL